MLKPYTENQKRLIVNNIVSACADISKLNNTGYKFISLASGFIAHYNLNGFKAFYSDSGRESLVQDITDNAKSNMWDNFKPTDDNYEYYMSKKDIYQRILGRLAAGQFLRDHFLVVSISDYAH